MPPYVPISNFLDTVSFDRSSEPNRDYPVGKAQYKLNVFPKEMSFGATKVGLSSDPQTAILVNSGYDDIVIHDVKIVGDFILFGNKPLTIKAGETASIQVKYAPKSLGAASGGAYINTGDAAGDELINLVGAATSGYISDLNTDLVKATNQSMGTANYIQAVTDQVLPAGNAKVLIAVNITQANTGPVQIAFNNEAALNVRNSIGNALISGDLAVGMMVVGYKLNGTFRLLIGSETAAIFAAITAEGVSTQVYAQQARTDIQNFVNQFGDINNAVTVTGANRVQTGLDRTQTTADRIQTGLDRVSVTASEILVDADRVQTGLDVISTAADRVVITNDKITVATNKGLVDTAKAAVDIAKTATDANVVLTNADVILAEADRVSTAADRVQTGLDRTAAAASAAILGDGDKGDIVVSGTGTVWNIDNEVITAAKINTGQTTAIKQKLSILPSEWIFI
jgi:hypothetical protein